MADHINMDTKNNPNSTVPQLEFKLPNTEIDEQLVVGEVGKITIPVEVIERTHESTSFRKRNVAEFSQFAQASLKDMEDDINEKYPPKDEK